MAGMLSGIHHVTAIASDAQRNVDFHAQTLGMRLVKTTIKYDDPGSYHLYYGDPPGFTAYEPIDSLGTSLRLPDWLEPRRVSIERALPSLQFPVGPEVKSK